MGDEQIRYVARADPLTDDTCTVPAPDPLLFATYDGSQGPGKPGTAGGALTQGVENAVSKVKDALKPGSDS